MTILCIYIYIFEVRDHLFSIFIFDYKFVSCLHNNHQVNTKTITQKHIHTIHMSGGHLGLALAVSCRLGVEGRGVEPVQVLSSNNPSICIH